jgi:hypothetical protein
MKGVIGAHIHIGKQGENGPGEAALFNPSKPTGPINGLLTAGTLTSSKLTGPLQGNLSLSALVNVIRRGEAYVDVHTTRSYWEGTGSDLIMCKHRLGYHMDTMKAGTAIISI